MNLLDEEVGPFHAEELVGEAQAATALRDVGDEGFLEPLGILCRALDEEAGLSVQGRVITRRFLLRLLAVRLQLVAYAGADSGVRDEVVAAPVVVAGAPRTGTTVLFGLLSLDPSLRAPLGWELLHPVPPPEPATRDRDPRIALAERELRRPAVATGDLDAIHVYGALQPKECLSAMSFDFRSEEFTARYHVPSYAEWLAACDMRPAYAWHRLVLQVLQRRQPTSRWLLKSPVHLHSLDALFATYPDARLAVTHRDPAAVLGSLVSLLATLRRAHSDRVDPAAIAATEAARWEATLDRLVDDPPAGASHSRYADFEADPLGTVAGVYERLGLPWSDDLAARMADHLAARPKGHAGEHRYSLDGTGLDEAATRARFARYCAAYL